jgi:hypothetical protein
VSLDVIQFNLFIYGLFSSPEGNYKVSMSQRRKANTHTHKEKQDTLYHLDNNKNPVSEIMPTIMR